MHDDEKRIDIPVRKVRQFVPVSDDLRDIAEMKLRESERMTAEATARLSPYDVARWFDVPPYLITLPELTDGKEGQG
jgi:hypothetical protein